MIPAIAPSGAERRCARLHRPRRPSAQRGPVPPASRLATRLALFVPGLPRRQRQATCSVQTRVENRVRFGDGGDGSLRERLAVASRRPVLRGPAVGVQFAHSMRVSSGNGGESNLRKRGVAARWRPGRDPCLRPLLRGPAVGVQLAGVLASAVFETLTPRLAA